MLTNGTDHDRNRHNCHGNLMDVFRGIRRVSSQHGDILDRRLQRFRDDLHTCRTHDYRQDNDSNGFQTRSTYEKFGVIRSNVLSVVPCGYMNGSRRLIARVAQNRMMLDVKSTPLSTTDEITDSECEMIAATIFATRRS